jgi:hypothetical protein
MKKENERIIKSKKTTTLITDLNKRSSFTKLFSFVTYLEHASKPIKTFLLFKLIARREKVLTKDLWYIIEPLLPKPLGTPRRLMVSNRKAMFGILYIILNDIFMERFA